jgi:hypothetical protein
MKEKIRCESFNHKTVQVSTFTQIKTLEKKDYLSMFIHNFSYIRMKKKYRKERKGLYDTTKKTCE